MGLQEARDSFALEERARSLDQREQDLARREAELEQAEASLSERVQTSSVARSQAITDDAERGLNLRRAREQTVDLERAIRNREVAISDIRKQHQEATSQLDTMRQREVDMGSRLQSASSRIESLEAKAIAHQKTAAELERVRSDASSMAGRLRDSGGHIQTLEERARLRDESITSLRGLVHDRDTALQRAQERIRELEEEAQRARRYV